MHLLLGDKLQSATTTEDTALWTKSNKNYIATASCPPKPLLCLYFSGHWWPLTILPTHHTADPPYC